MDSNWSQEKERFQSKNHLLNNNDRTDFLKSSLVSGHLRLHEALCLQEQGHSEVSMPCTPESPVPHCTTERTKAINTWDVRDAFPGKLQRAIGDREEAHKKVEKRSPKSTDRKTCCTSSCNNCCLNAYKMYYLMTTSVKGSLMFGGCPAAWRLLRAAIW